MKRTMVVFSGGMDSATLLCHLRDKGHVLQAISIDYKQRHLKELWYAKLFCSHLSVPLTVLDLRTVGALLRGSSQTDLSVPVPHGHYQADTMKQTVVPNRNMLLLAAAASVAITEKCDSLAYGAHAGDHDIYPDCRPEFINIMRQAFLQCDWNPLELLVPFQDWTKGAIAREGVRLGVPYELTWTCYEGKARPCGLCGACCERREAFQEAGVKDPLEANYV
jgi:7-cyano-7-deazaguanine synthase